MTLAISMLNNIFPLHTKTQNYHRTYPNVLRQMSQCKYLFSLEEVTYVDEEYHIGNMTLMIL